MKIAIASGKGGTGKTTLAVNLASYLCFQSGTGHDEIVLVDLDVEEPNAGLFFNLNLKTEEAQYRKVPFWNEDKCTLCGKCKSVCQFNAIVQLPGNIMIFPELCHSCFACSELCPEMALPMINRNIGMIKHYNGSNHFPGRKGISFIEGTLNIGEPSAVPLIKKTKQYVDDNFQAESLKIFDCPPGTSCPVIESVKNTDYVILVTEPTPFGLHDLKLAVETMRKMERRFGVVVNRFGIGNDEVLDYCKAENIEVIAKIPDDRKIAEKCSKGLLVWKDNHEFNRQMENIQNCLIHDACFG